jgi:hypothetical protein
MRYRTIFAEVRSALVDCRVVELRSTEAAKNARGSCERHGQLAISAPTSMAAKHTFSAYVPFLCDQSSAFRRQSPQPDANTLRQPSGPRMTVRS